MKVLITGCAGFIGFSFANYLLDKNVKVLGIDNFDKYYSIKLKKKRISILKQSKFFNEQAKLIQKYYRGYYSRKYEHDFYARKTYLIHV